MKSTTSRKRSSTTKAAAGLTASQKTAKAKTLKKAYVFRVALSDDNEIYSDILIRADQTLEDLHEIIFEAFNREEEHLYCFYIGGTRVSSPDCELDDDELDASETKLKEISFEVGDGFGYLFDFGEEWQHDIELLEIVPVGKNVGRVECTGSSLMFGLGGNQRIYYCPTPVNLRKSFDGLAGAVQQYINQDPASGHLFVFFSRNKKLVKMIYYQDGGMCLFAKRLERGQFNLPVSAAGKIELEPRELYAILSGIKPHRYYKRYSKPETG